MVKPEDALQAVRTAITLGAVVPEMRAQADALAGDLADLAAVRKQILAERDKLASDIELLGREQLRMSLLVDQRQKKQAIVEQALDSERQHATDLARQVDTIKDLISKLEQDLDPAARAKRDSGTPSKTTPASPISPRWAIPDGCRRPWPSPTCADACVCRSMVRGSATLAVPTVPAEPKKDFLSWPGPVPKLLHLVMVGWSMPGRFAVTGNS